ncbi:3-isopropylmalate dehydrogenase [Betaproteobacteria bacterium]|nr:3-isopropylmalate dehydrogenase [Betaproteobacteria bacterium]
MASYKIACLPGDGVGPEVTAEGVKVLKVAQELSGAFSLEFENLVAGANLYQTTGEVFPDAAYETCKKADAIFLGAMGLPQVTYPDGTEVQGSIIVRMRKEFNLFAGVRPIKLYPGVQSPLRNADKIDFVILRESSEGMFASFQAGAEVFDKVHVDSMVITREGTEKVCEWAFKTSQQRNGRPSDGKKVVTCVDKSNNFKGMAFWRKIYNEIAAKYPDIGRDYSYVDAINIQLILHPQDYDVIVAENIYGDIISDMAGALVGSMGMCPSGDIGYDHGLFQPAHGSAPTLAGKNIVNPLATILSGGMMLDWLGDKHNNQEMKKMAVLIESAVEKALLAGNKTTDIGGTTSTSAMGDSVVTALKELCSK